MIVHEVFAQISDNTIKNIIVCSDYTLANYLAHATYGDSAFAVDCLQYPCQIGDKYINNQFYKEDGITPIKYVPTQEQQVEQLNRENTDLQLALTEQFEKNLVLQDGLTNAQLALAELYERTEV